MTLLHNITHNKPHQIRLSHYINESTKHVERGASQIPNPRAKSKFKTFLGQAEIQFQVQVQDILRPSWNPIPISSSSPSWSQAICRKDEAPQYNYKKSQTKYELLSTPTKQLNTCNMIQVKAHPEDQVEVEIQVQSFIKTLNL